ncbi:conserved hypothetical bacteriophage protein [Salmonella enterica subsp. enterica serovar Typhi]|nr:conserved hypothetical bacteriophage protein [Salmonella enterica subsp. enterica serovar Typhi]
MSNIDKRATEMLIENGVLVADTLRSLADNEIDSDYFAICHTNENGTEIECELAITDYARQAAGTVDDLVNALEVAEKRIAELEAREISLPERSSMLHRTDFHEDYQTVMAYKVSEVIAAIRAAGIRIKGE